MNDLEAAFRAGVKAEREACAKMLEEEAKGDDESGYDSQLAYFCNSMAAAIRARGEEQQQ